MKKEIRQEKKQSEEQGLKIQKTEICLEQEEENPGIEIDIVIGPGKTDVDIKKQKKDEEKSMKNQNYAIKAGDFAVVDGKVVVSSEELAAAIQEKIVNLDAEEEIGGIIDIDNFFCRS